MRCCLPLDTGRVGACRWNQIFSDLPSLGSPPRSPGLIAGAGSVTGAREARALGST